MHATRRFTNNNSNNNSTTSKAQFDALQKAFGGESGRTIKKREEDSAAEMLVYFSLAESARSRMTQERSQAPLTQDQPRKRRTVKRPREMDDLAEQEPPMKKQQQSPPLATPLTTPLATPLASQDIAMSPVSVADSDAPPPSPQSMVRVSISPSPTMPACEPMKLCVLTRSMLEQLKRAIYELVAGWHDELKEIADKINPTEPVNLAHLLSSVRHSASRFVYPACHQYPILQLLKMVEMFQLTLMPPIPCRSAAYYFTSCIVGALAHQHKQSMPSPPPPPPTIVTTSPLPQSNSQQVPSQYPPIGQAIYWISQPITPLTR